MTETILHASHQHVLELKSYNQFYVCDGCKETGIGARFQCECDFHLHIECARSSNQISSHHFFQNTTFKFIYKPSDHERYCNACVKPVKSFMYHSREKGWDLHPICVNLPPRLKVDDVIFKLFDKELSTKCIWCNMRRLVGNFSGVPGWSYASTCNKYNLHVRCATEMMLQVGKKETDLGNNWKQSIQGPLEKSILRVLERKRRKNIVMIFKITNVVLELISAVLDQFFSVNKPQCALFGMVISFVAMLTCVLEIIYEGQEEKLIWRWRGTLPLPWFYYQDGERKPFGTFKDIVGLVCALCQCVFATVNYCHLRRHVDSPIKISIYPIAFAFGILFSQILKNGDRERPFHENETFV